MFERDAKSRGSDAEYRPRVKRAAGAARAGRTGSAIKEMFEGLESRVLMSANYFVSPNGNDGGDGSAQSPWKTLQHAADLVAAGDVVHVAAGTYTGFCLGWDDQRSGLPGSPIVFEAAPGAIINRANGRTPDGINLEGSSYVTIRGFAISNSTGTITRAGIRAVTDNHVIIEHNSIDGAGNWGIFTGFSDDVLIQYNTASHSQTQHGIYVSNSGDRPVIRGNICFGNFACGIHMNGDASQGGDGIISGALVEGNRIYDNGAAGGSGINADGVQHSIFRNNLLYDNHASGISLFRQDAGGSSIGNLVVNNTIIEASDARWCINIVDASTGNTVVNNILCNLNAGHGAINIAANSRAGFASDYNLIINNRFTPNDGDSFMTLAQWRAATLQDAHSIVAADASAVFADFAGNDFHLAPASPAVDAGRMTGAPLFDIEGGLRPTDSGMDIGAYESNAAILISDTTTTVTPSTLTPAIGKLLTLNIAVTANDPAGAIPSGSVTLVDAGAILATLQLDAQGHAFFSSANLALGDHALSAVYAGTALSGASQGDANVTVMPRVLSSIAVSKAPLSLLAAGTCRFTAIGYDQVGEKLKVQPAFSWSVKAGGSGGTISPAGTYAAPSVGPGSDDLVASAGGVDSAPLTVSFFASRYSKVGGLSLIGSALGSFAYNFKTGVYAMTARGSGIGGTKDQFAFAAAAIRGDKTLTARLASLESASSAASAGIMMRDGRGASAAFIALSATVDGNLVLQWRSATGAAAQSLTFAGSAPLWLRLVRAGTTISAYSSDDGAAWQLIGSQTIVLKSAVAGLNIASGDPSSVASASFDHVNLVATL